MPIGDGLQRRPSLLCVDNLASLLVGDGARTPAAVFYKPLSALNDRDKLVNAGYAVLVHDGETGWTYQHPNGMKCRAAKLGEDYTPSAVARSLSANAEREKQQEATSEKLLAAGVEDVARKRAEEAARIRQQQEAERVLRQAQERAERARVRTRSRDDGERGFSR